MSQIIRRVCFDETIPHHEKIFSIFEPHTEWISKGKAGVPVELGLRVNLIEDQDQFILHHQVMRRQTDEKVAVEIVEETKKRFPELAVVSWDKGAHSPQNQRELKALPDLVVLPKKGKLSKQTGREKIPGNSNSCAANTLRSNPPSTLRKCTDSIDVRIMESRGSNAMSLWLCLQKTSTVSAPFCVNSKKNGSVVNEDPTKKRPEPKSDSPF